MTQALELYDVYQTKVLACDKKIEAILMRLKKSAEPPTSELPLARQKTRQPNAPAFEAREALNAILGVDLTQIHGLGPYLALKLVGECGTNLAAWPSAKHFTSWLALAPHNKISGGKCCRRKRGAAAIGPHHCYASPPSRLGEPTPRWAHSTGGCRPGSAKPRRSRNRAQNRRSILQHASTRHGLRGSRRSIL